MIANQPLIGMNTLRLPARAAFFSAPESLLQLQQDLADARSLGLPVTVIGEGSNLVIADDLAGLVIRPRLSGMRIIREDETACVVEAGAGEHFDDLIRWTLAQGLQGLENLSLIPGSVGAAPFQNIGAYGVELGDRLLWVEAVSIANGELRQFPAGECALAYRDSLFKSHQRGCWIITSIALTLDRQSAGRPLTLHYADLAQRLSYLEIKQQNALGLRDIICALRRSKLPDPAQLANAGSFFKNPLVTAEHAEKLQRCYPQMPVYPQVNGQVKLAAGWLIEMAGFKGYRQGPVGMHHQQALVLVNYGGATAVDVLTFAETVKHAVLQKFGVELEQEPVVLRTDHSQRD